MMKAFELNPRYARWATEIGITCICMRRYEEAEKFLDSSLALAPNQTYAYVRKSLLYLLWRGDLKASRSALEQVMRSDPDETFSGWFFQLLYERDYQKALVWLDSTGMDQREEQAWFWPIAQLRGWLYDLLGDRGRAVAAYECARVLLETKLQAQPDDYLMHGSLGFVYGGLGRKEDAIRAGKQAIELIPVSQDALAGPLCLETLARIYATVDEADASLDLLEHLLEIPSWTSVQALKLDPSFDSLRDHPRFQKLLGQPDRVF